MAKIEFPKPLKALLEESALQAPIRALADRVGEILTDNKLTFFPDYTDHGVDHINCVLKSEVRLVPKTVWEQSKEDSDPRLLCDADAVVIIGATLLHDIAMHLQPPGFLELISKESRFKPLAWFKDSHEGHFADLPWNVLWEEYQLEARRFSDRKLATIIGEESALSWKFHELPEDCGRWERNHNLVIGEFIRRHHARLAHEIAIYGFPGITIGSGKHQFPAMGDEPEHILRDLADLIGLAARSHGTSLRVCTAYLDSHPPYSGTSRPMGTAVLYPMALLRVADYLQIDQKRTPPVLLQLRDPQSPISVMEWQKHKAVQNISSSAKDPRGIWITVNSDLSLPLYLQLRDLISGLQKEMDHSTAVLDETYGLQSKHGLDMLNLEVRRVHSNLQNPDFLKSLPYVPEQTGFSSDPNLLTLLVEPLYGKEPSVGVRELTQNAVDAVLELEVWCKNHNRELQSIDLPKQDADVLIDFILKENGTWLLRIIDRGIGMSSDTIQNYFLRAGASFRTSKEWAKEFLDEKSQPKVIRAGRFGIGAFAVFLLGPKFRLETRHANANKTSGFKIEASATSQLIEIRRADNLPVGTMIEVELSKGSESIFGRYRWYCWDWPNVVMRCIIGDSVNVLEPQTVLPIRKSRLPHWSVIHPTGFDAVFWTFGDAPTLSCNGMVIRNPKIELFSHTEFYWPPEAQLRQPCVAIIDSAGNLPLTTQRYGLSQVTLPFTDELARDVVLSFIAHALVCGPSSPWEATTKKRTHPLCRSSIVEIGSTILDKESEFIDSTRFWCYNSTAFVPGDSWLFSLLNSEVCLVVGKFCRPRSRIAQLNKVSFKALLAESTQKGFAILDLDIEVAWSSVPQYHDEEDYFQEQTSHFLEKLSHHSLEPLLGHTIASRVIVSEKQENHEYFETISPRRFWDELPKPNSLVRFFEKRVGNADLALSLESILITMQAESKGKETLFACELKIEVEQSPESMIAHLWNECLGPKAIPFDPDERRALIAEGCKHPELKRHIESWQEMKRLNSIWVR